MRSTVMRSTHHFRLLQVVAIKLENLGSFSLGCAEVILEQPQHALVESLVEDPKVLEYQREGRYRRGVDHALFADLRIE